MIYRPASQALYIQRPNGNFINGVAVSCIYKGLQIFYSQARAQTVLHTTYLHSNL